VTHRNLGEAIANRTFREDLYYRLNVFTLVLPSLRELKQDIVGIAEFLINRHTPPHVRPVVITSRLREALVNFPWPGNIRQLENTVRKLIVLRDPDRIASELELVGVVKNGNSLGGNGLSENSLNGSADTQSNEDVPRKRAVAEAELILQASGSSFETRLQGAAI
jgi:transcriptional regulator with PAS, ATPase and Fis domain